MLPVTVIILTLNEEKHLSRCLQNVKKFTNDINIIDSGSFDETRSIAESYGVGFYSHHWEGSHARQFNWALNNIKIGKPWILRLDADEYFPEILINELNELFEKLDDTVNGIALERKMVFYDTLIKYGMPKMDMLRIFRYGFGKCEDRIMDEHIVIEKGECIKTKNYFVDHSLKSFGWWIEKHNKYSILEAIEMIGLRSESKNMHSKLSAGAENKRRIKHRYANCPLFFRAFCYFLYRYIIKLGFLQGRVGFLWHFMQGFWYRMLVDSKILEMKIQCGNNKTKLKKYVKNEYGIIIT